MKTSCLNAAVLLLLGIFSGCGNEGKGDVKSADSTKTNDSVNAAHHVDPATAFPQPPVTGTTQDSSRTKDSSQKQ
jgi:hypothetical protein